MPHPLVLQLRFTRSEFQRGLLGVTDEEARRRFMPMNCISWLIGHLAFQEQMYWLVRAQGTEVAPDLREIAGWGMPATTPPLDQMWDTWNKIVTAADPWLDALTTDKLTTHMIVNGREHPESIGTMLRRCTYHYWYHLGEGMAIRQMLGHTGLEEFVGDIGVHAPYVAEDSR